MDIKKGCYLKTIQYRKDNHVKKEKRKDEKYNVNGLNCIKFFSIFHSVILNLIRLDLFIYLAINTIILPKLHCIHVSII